MRLTASTTNNEPVDDEFDTEDDDENDVSERAPSSAMSGSIAKVPSPTGSGHAHGNLSISTTSVQPQICISSTAVTQSRNHSNAVPTPAAATPVPTAQRAAATSGRGLSICCVMTTLLVLAGTIGLPFAIFDVAGQSNSESSGSAIAASGSYRRAALALSGGGFRAMTGDMALARALARIGAWESVTHVSSVSGGTWFSSLFFYVPAFHEKVVGNDPLREVVAAMSDDYSAALERALTTGGFRTLASRDMTAHSACSYIFARAMDALMNVNIFVFPATDWFAYVSLAVLPNLPPERTYTAQRTTPVLEDITLIHNTAVTKTAWVGSGDNRKLVELVVEVGAPRETAVGSWVAAPFEHVATLPLYYVSSRRNATYREGWLLPPAFSSNLYVRAYGSGEPLKPSDSTVPGWKLVLTHCECHPWGVPGRLKPQGSAALPTGQP